MINKYELEYLNKQKDEDRTCYTNQLDIERTHALFNKHYDLNSNERYIIAEFKNEFRLIDKYIRNDFIATILYSNSLDVLNKEKNKLLNNGAEINEQLKLF